jgi:hypothetical protein
MKKSFVFRNSKSLSNATGSVVTFSMTFGSSRAVLPKADRARKKANTAAANLISIIKALPEGGVNAQRAVLIDITHAMELPQIGK